MCKLITLVNLLSTIESKPIINDVKGQSIISIVQISVQQDKVPCIPAIYDKETTRHKCYVTCLFALELGSRIYSRE